MTNTGNIPEMLAEVYTWLREPDNVEVASLEWLMDWVDRRPIATVGMIAMLLPVTGERGE